jgi:Tol biopolymer transport system component
VLVSAGPDGQPGGGGSIIVSVTDDGRYVVFQSTADLLNTHDTNGLPNLFVRDLQTGQTTRVSVGLNGQSIGAGIHSAMLSAEGQRLAFDYAGDDLASGDTNEWPDVFVRDLQTGQITLVSAAPNGKPGNGESGGQILSADGRYVAFVSFADDLVPGDTNGEWDVFVRDLQTGQTRLVSVGLNGQQGNDVAWLTSMSADGRYVGFDSKADNLASGDTNGQSDVFVRDLQTRQTFLVSAGLNGRPGSGESFGPDLSVDGRYVVFGSHADDLLPLPGNAGALDVFVHDLQTGQTRLVSAGLNGAAGNDASYAWELSKNSRYIAFESKADNLVSGDTNGLPDVFVCDLQTGTITLASIALNGQAASLGAKRPSISADGQFVVFESSSDDLVSGDTNGTSDIFVRHLQARQTVLVSVRFTGQSGNDVSFSHVLAAGEPYVAFESLANDLASGDTNNAADVFVMRIKNVFLFP